MTRRKDGLWQEVLVINGKRKYFYGKTKAEVLNKLRDYKIMQEKGPLVVELAEQWYEYRAPLVTYKTAESYIAPLKQIKEHFDGLYVIEITPPQISAFIRQVEKRGYARRTVQMRLDVLRMMFDYAIAELGVISANPCEAVSLSSNLPAKRRELPEAQEIAAIVAHADDDRFSLLPFLLCYTGMRLGEALALTDKDFANGYITVNKKVSWQPNQPVVEDWTKTQRGIRRVPILDVLKNKLPTWRGYLFSDDGVKPYSKSMFMKRWRKYSKLTGVKSCRHALRHEFTTLMYEAGVDTKEAADILGHDEKIMRDIYTHIRENRRENTASKLNDYVNSVYDTP